MSDSIVIARPDPSALVREFSPLAERARALVVSDQDSHATALESIKALRGVEKKLEEHYEPTRKALDTAKKELLRARDSMIAPFAEARGIVDRAASEYEREQRRLAEQAEREAREKARREEEERQLRDAIAAEEAGDTQQAEAILEQPVEVPVVRVEAPVAKVAGVSARETWAAEITDKLALIRHVAAHPDLVGLLEANMPALNQQARSLKGEMRIPGVRAVATTVRSVRSA